MVCHKGHLNVACSGVKALCPSSRIQAHIHVPDTTKEMGWIIRAGQAKGLDSHVEQSPPEALRPGEWFRWLSRDQLHSEKPSRTLTLFTFNWSE